MAEELMLLEELGNDADLLLTTDDWLEISRIQLQQELSLIASQLNSVLSAQRIKEILQQRNMVAVRNIAGSNEISICSIVEALRQLDRERTDPAVPASLSRLNSLQHLKTWECDGYDVDNAQNRK